MKLKLIALLLAVCMVFSCLTACGQSKPAETPDTPAETEAPAEETPGSDENTAPAGPYTKMFADAYATYAPDTVVATVGDEEITWGVYFSWFYTTLMQLSSYSIDITDFDLEVADGLTLGDYVRGEIENMLLQYGVINSKARELNLALNDEDLATIDTIMQADAVNYYDGDVEQMLSMFAQMYITEDVYRYMTASSLLYQKLFSHFMGENGEKVSEEDLVGYATANGVYKAKHILLKTIDDARQPLDDETIEQKRGQIEDILKELKALPPEELEAKFDELIREVGEDQGSLAYPSGYYFSAGQAVPEFEEAANALEIGQLSDIVESSYGFHILYRPAMNGNDIFSIDTSTGTATTLRQAVSNALFSNIAMEWFNSSEISYADGFEDLDYSELLVLPEMPADESASEAAATAS